MMNKRQLREFYWFAKGFLVAAERLYQRSQERDPKNRSKRANIISGIKAATMCVEFEHTPLKNISRKTK